MGEILRSHQDRDVATSAIAAYQFDVAQGREGKLELVRYNVTSPMKAERTSVTAVPDKIVEARA